MKTLKNQMQWVSALSTRPSLEAALKEVLENTRKNLQGSADLALVFISSAFASEYSRLMPLLREEKIAPVIIGCSGGGVVGMSPTGEALEVEGEPALSLTLASLPGVDVHAFHLDSIELPDLDSPPDTWVDLIGVDPAAKPQFILLSDPFFGKTSELLEGLDYAYPDAPKVGGLASAGVTGRALGLFCNYRLYQEGTIGVALSGNVVLDTIVAQGCRPIGQVYRVVEGEKNVVLSLAEDVEMERQFYHQSGQPPLEALRALVQNLSDIDRELVQHSLFIGIVRDEFKQKLETGDFLIRNLLGVDPKGGAIAIADKVRPGQRIQFHLRDAKTSAEDLEVLLKRYQRELPPHSNIEGAGALMFACMGRGEGLYGLPNFDSNLFSRYLSPMPLSGFFCNGEVGPVGGGTFLHGYTSVFAICRQIE